MSSGESLNGDQVARLLPSALTRPAAEGARIVTLHWLLQLQHARGDWARATLADVDASGSSHDDRRREAVDALHRARVALRRLRASCKEHRALLKGSRVSRNLDALSRLQRATNAARDADVQHDWLNAEGEGLPDDARAQSVAMRAKLLDGNDGRQRRVSAAFRRHFDPLVERFAARLSSYRSTQRLGDDRTPMSFAEHVAQRLELAALHIREELAALETLDAGELPEALHRLRIHLKRQRAMLAPHTTAHGAIGAWYDMATRGQDLLGAMRDAAVLSAQARYEGADALAEALNDVALAHQEAFQRGWCNAPEAITRAQHAAAAALRTLGPKSPSAETGLPMEFERKYLLTGCPPEAEAVAPTRIVQGWLPGTTLRERLRHSTNPDGRERFTRTIKLGPARARIEVEEDTDRETFDSLWPLTHAARIRKQRHVVKHDSHRWEIDVFLDRELVVAEVELSHEFEVAMLPPWLAPYVVRDVTGDPAYFNAVMARAERAVSAPHE